MTSSNMMPTSALTLTTLSMIDHGCMMKANMAEIIQPPPKLIFGAKILTKMLAGEKIFAPMFVVHCAKADRKRMMMRNRSCDGAGADGVIIPKDRAVGLTSTVAKHRRSEERRVGKECRSRWSPYH